MASAGSLTARDILALGLFLALCFVAAGVGSAATAPSLDPWYESLAKPWWTPPDSAFPIAWSILYAMMALAAWLAWRAPAQASARRRAMAAFAIQLGINVSWSWAFFAAQSPSAGLAVILLLLPAIVVTMRLFLPLDRRAAWLLVPYLVWVTFAAALNTAILVMNA